MNIEDRIRARLQRGDALEIENEKLRAALRPFADQSMSSVTKSDDRQNITNYVMSGAWYPSVTLGDFRRAHDVLYGVKITP